MRNSILLFVICALAPLAFGAGASHWNHTTEADFKKGKFNNTVATNLGDVKLSRAVKTLLEQDAKITAVYALAEAVDGTIYAGTGPQGIVLSLKGEKVSTIATLDDANVFSLLIDADGKLLIGTGGEKGRILRVEKSGEKPVEIFSA
ncbi:MAG TPA: two-component regulator propeller domain-containing protein, partial [Tepidisphaeraceae bacterium]|nr:two-component regulator propeller domain-containing protein [Tepidisphaeraceae bacterium]